MLLPILGQAGVQGRTPMAETVKLIEDLEKEIEHDAR
jgi:hypothetical protein